MTPKEKAIKYMKSMSNKSLDVWDVSLNAIDIALGEQTKEFINRISQILYNTENTIGVLAKEQLESYIVILSEEGESK